MKMIRRSCPICGSTDESRVFTETNVNTKQLDEFAFASRKVPEYMHYRLISCPICDLLYASPVPKQNIITKAYEKASFDTSQEAHYASRTYASFLPQIIKNLPDLIGALDIGTGDGAFLEQLVKLDFKNIIGVEPSIAPIRNAGSEIQPLIKQGIFNSQDFEKDKFSLVTCFQTLEHLYDPAAMCRDAYQILKNKGALFFVCHNYRSFSTKLLGMKSPVFDIQHLQLFSTQSVKYLMEQSGFVNIEIKRVYNKYPLQYWLKLFPLPTKIKKISLPLLKKLRIAALQISIPAGNMAVIGYKN